MIRTPLTIYVDEAGSADYREAKPGEKLRAYVPCAVAVPEQSAAALLAAIPRDSSANLLKSSAAGMTDDLACGFLRALFASDADIAAVQIDPGTKQSREAALSNTDLVNQRRKEVHHQSVKPQNFTYSLFLSDVIARVLGQVLRRRHQLPSCIDVVLDEANLADKHEEHVREAIRLAIGSQAVSVADVRWTTEQNSPLLLLPDIVAGVLWHRGMHGYKKNATKLIRRAEESGRIAIRDGYRIHLWDAAERAKRARSEVHAVAMKIASKRFFGSA